MNKANVSYTRNHLSELLLRVKEGESILIEDLQLPIARLEPVVGASASGLPWQDDLVRRGLLRSARSPLDFAKFSAMPIPTPRSGGDILNSLLSDREDGR